MAGRLRPERPRDGLTALTSTNSRGPKMAKQALHPWSTDALLTKSQMYFEEMLKHFRDEWQFALSSSLALELLARAALSRISPTLLADTKGPDNKGWDNTYYALGHTPLTAKFSPASIGIREVLSR